MTFEADNFLLVASILLLASIVISKTGSRVGIPTLLLFIFVGMFAGSEGIGGIQFDDPKLTQFIGVVALNFILFSGGLETQWTSIKPVLWRGVALSTVGVLLTALSIGLFVFWITDFSLLEGLLLGAIVSSTDAAAVFSILRSKNIGLKRNLRPTLELESGSNDPMAYFLTISLTFLIVSGDASWFDLIWMFVKQMALGAIVGIAMGYINIRIINRIKLQAEGLYPVLVMALMFFTFAFTDIIGGNGFLAIYISAIILGNSKFIHKKSLIRFYDGQAWLMQILIFLTLGLLVFPSRILPLMGIGLLISLFLILIARPLSVFLSLSPFNMKIREKIFISWVGLRGAVPIVFATYPLIAGVDKAGTIFNLVFFISTTSVLLQGTTLPIVAKWLRLIVPEKAKRKFAIDIELSDESKNALLEIELSSESSAINRKIVELPLPKNVLIVLINRDGKYITPSGSTRLEQADRLIITGDNDEAIEKTLAVLNVSKVNELDTLE
ncbi:MAG: potassium/proton antiporter [Bacteroidota bacterium]